MFKKENFKIPFYLMIAIIAAVSVSISIQSLFAAWQAPSATPPSANIDAPVNVGGGTQVKSGEFGVTNDFYVGGANTFFVDGLGTGNVGIGVINPNNLLQVSGLINFPNDKYGTFLGYQAGNANTGYENTFIGYQNGFFNTAGSYNSAMGFEALFNNNTGSYNTAMGYLAGRSITTGNFNTFLGSEAGYSVNQKSDALESMAIGYGAYTTSNFQVVIGSNNITQTLLKGNVGIGTTNPQTKLEVTGVIKTTPTAPAPTCNANSMGGIYYNSTSNNFFGCRLNGAVYEWTQLNN